MVGLDRLLGAHRSEQTVLLHLGLVMSRVVNENSERSPLHYFEVRRPHLLRLSVFLPVLECQYLVINCVAILGLCSKVSLSWSYPYQRT